MYSKKAPKKPNFPPKLALYSENFEISHFRPNTRSRRTRHWNSRKLACLWRVFDQICEFSMKVSYEKRVKGTPDFNKALFSLKTPLKLPVFASWFSNVSIRNSTVMFFDQKCNCIENSNVLSRKTRFLSEKSEFLCEKSFFEILTLKIRFFSA